MECKQCGNNLAETATMCTKCGWKTENWKKQAKKAKDIHTTNWLAILYMIGLIIFFFVFRSLAS